MNSDYILIFLIFLCLLLFYLAMKYFKFLFFYLGIFIGILMGVYGKIFIDESGFNLVLLKNILLSWNDFFKNSQILKYLTEHLWILFSILFIMLFYKLFYYFIIILIHFIKWLIKSIKGWFSSRKKGIIEVETEDKINN